ncbi:ABC transporter substrate-binding protein [Microbulbifer elongatus]|uniref:ABC transporter substrate-binding protein n=1 Tax=Microbulbifer elongatus TaxID=86173 RepID=UPI001CFEFC20|nr:sugar ABC transporter substrate-binding protein [Microbulbifer elongatus]
MKIKSWMLVLASALALLGSGFSAAASTTRIQFWTMQLSPFHDDYVNGLIAEFERLHPEVQVKWVDVPWKEMEKKMLASVAAGTAPDVVNLNPQFAAKLAEFGALANPERYLSRQQVDAYLPNIWNANRFEGEAFAIPWYLSTTVTIYNRALLERAGVSVPASFSELLSTSKVLRQKLDKYAYFPAMDGSRPLENLAATGVELVAEDGSVGFDNERGLAFFRFNRDMYQQGLIPKNVLTEGHHKAVDLFQSGQVALITTGMQFLQTIRTNAPELFANVEVAPQLKHPQSKNNVAVMNLAVPVMSAHKSAAFDFATFVTNHENQMALARRIPLLPSTAVSYQDPFFSLPENPSVVDRARAISAQQVLSGDVLVPPLPKYSKLKTSFVFNLQSAMVGELTAEQALARTSDTWALFLQASKRKARAEQEREGRSRGVVD